MSERCAVFDGEGVGQTPYAIKGEWSRHTQVALWLSG